MLYNYAVETENSTLRNYSSTLSAIVQCQAWDSVCVVARTNGDIYDSIRLYTQFSGLLLREGLE